VVLNVLSNAIKYSATRETSIICVDARRLPGDLVEYRVSDNGVGFDMDAAGKLFKVFQRLHSESEFAGTGIGLAICRRIVERHGGRIWAQSIRDTGTTMHFSLPRAQPPQRRRPPFQTSHAFGDPPMEEPGIRGKRHPEAPHHGNLHHKPVHWQ